MGISQRRKGRTGQTKAANLLRDRDWIVADLSAGISSEDLLAVSPLGVAYAVEVKNCKAITVQHRKQAQEQAIKRKAKWMLMSHIEGTSAWLIQQQGQDPVIWKEKHEHAKGNDIEVSEERPEADCVGCD